MQHNHIEVLQASQDELTEKIGHFILAEARKAIIERNRFKLVLAGGSSPLMVYRWLAENVSDFSHWSFYFGDERYVPYDDSLRNSKVILEILQTTSIGEEQIYLIPYTGNIDADVIEYNDVILAAGQFDLIISGIGEDGHTASLFPGRAYLAEPVYAVYDSPKPPAERITLGLSALRNTENHLVISMGSGKQAAITDLMNGNSLPITEVTQGMSTLLCIDNSVQL